MKNALSDRERGRRNRKNNRGYTMVELIVVIAILLILAGTITFAVTKWIRYAQFKKQNETAQTLFNIAQNQLTSASISGELQELQQTLDNDSDMSGKVYPLNLAGMKGADGKEYDLAKIWPESAKSSTSDKASDYRENICSLRGTAETYQEYQKYKKGEQANISESLKILYDLLVPYVYDESILKASVCLEFTPEDGQVFAVLYSSSDKEFEYNSSNTNTNGTVDISNREYSYRYNRMVGYYGVDTLYKSTSPKTLKPSIGEVSLNNQETLNLSFKVTKVKDAARQMVYEIRILDEATSKPILSICLNGADQKIKEKTFARSGKYPVECPVTIYKSTGEKEFLGNMNFLVWQEEDETFRMVLDAADLCADTQTYYSAFPYLGNKDKASLPNVTKMTNTNSFHRFGIENEGWESVENVKCTIQGTGTIYKTTAKKESNIENLYFSSYKKEETEDGNISSVYDIKNARHLYNVRYIEDYSATVREKDNYKNLKGRGKVVYQVAEDIDWAQFVEAGYLYYDNSSLEKEIITSFPSIKQLRSSSAFKGSEQQETSIQGLKINQKANDQWNVYADFTTANTEQNDGINTAADEENNPSEEAKNEEPVGLFVKNKGTIENLTLDQVEVQGTNWVGAFCGKNDGVSMKNLTVKADSVKDDPTKDEEEKAAITGEKYVGAIFGGQEVVDQNTELSNLSNYADVSGIDYVGGIAGNLTLSKAIGQENTFTYEINNAYNEGIIETREKYGCFIGGIIGYGASDKQNKVQLKLVKCKSVPQNSETLAIISQKDTLKSKLKGICVGGVAGCLDNVTLDQCNTETYKKNTSLFGNQYVGGIVGYVQNISVLEGTSAVNQIAVFGNQYVGGIVGCSAKEIKESFDSKEYNIEDYSKKTIEERNLTVEDSSTKKQVEVYAIPKPSDKKEENIEIRNWTNKGVVYATTSYVGGITGYNVGDIWNCDANVQHDNVFNKLQTLLNEKKLDFADYAGGITGYNNGNISSDTTKTIFCQMVGDNFVGGVVGYNDEEAKIKNCKISGGSVLGTGSYIGGYAGFNASVHLLVEEDLIGAKIQASAKSVKGRYCVGGAIGGNVIPLNKEIKTEFASDNFLGKIQATEGVAGGFIAYNAFVDKDTSKQMIKAAAEESKDRLEQLEISDSSHENVIETGDALPHKIKTDKIDLKGSNNNAVELVIRGTGEDAETEVRFEGITGKIYVGGTIGYNEDQAKLTVKNVVNYTVVKATKAVAYDKEQPGREKEQFTYSYAGGIIGKVTSKMQVINCKNQDSGSVEAKGTYTGGICEINEGQIQKCNVSNQGTTNTDYIGGIAGLNKKGATIQECIFNNKTLTGRKIVGGIAAENFGTIQDTELKKATINAGGNYVGGITAYNYEDGTILFKADNNVKISSKGDDVGGVTAVNKGSITTDKTGIISGSVQGNQSVAGIVAENENGKIENFKNEAKVTALEGEAAGIVVTNSSKDAEITYCVNTGTITAQKQGNAGGITVTNDSTIKACENTGEVSAQKGFCGGISAINHKNIQSCKVQGTTEGKYLEFEGNIAGGVCAKNEKNKKNNVKAEIKDCTVENIRVKNLATSTDSRIGGVAAINDGTIVNSNIGTEKKAIDIVSYASDVLAGGIAGENAGSIGSDTDELKDKNTIYATVRFTTQDASYYGNLGGVAGQNTGSIKNCEVSGEVEGTGNNPKKAPKYNLNTDYEESGAVIYGYGGIVGVNGKTDSSCPTATIAECHVEHMKVTGLGDTNNIVNIGGAAGVNGQLAMIRKVTLGSQDQSKNDYKIYKPTSAVGLITGNETASVYVFSDLNKYAGAYSHSGGIAGINDGTIKDIANTEKEEHGEVIVQTNRGHVGGIAGFNRRTGSIHDVNAGNKTGQWVVSAINQAQDNGCGGIIGYSGSQSALYHCKNYAKVNKSVGSSNAVGGMIGRLEVPSKTFQISNCENYGDVEGNNRTAGIVGVIKYNGGTVQDCKNFGNIQQDNANNASAGIIAYLYHVTSPLYIYRCENHGDITKAGKCGGIFGEIDNGSPQVSIYYSINTGRIWEDMNYTISGGISASSNANIKTIYGCRNYGYAINANGVTTNNLSGIAPKDTQATISNCFGIAQVVYPITASFAGKTLESDYIKIGEDSVVEDRSPYIKMVTVSTKGFDGEANLPKITLTSDTIIGDNAYYSGCNSSNPPTYVFQFSEDITLDKMKLFWYRATEERFMLYDIYYKEGAEWRKINKETINGKENRTSPYEFVEFGQKIKTDQIKVVVCGSGNKSNLNISENTYKVNVALQRVHFFENDKKLFEDVETTSTGIKQEGSVKKVEYKKVGSIETNSSGQGDIIYAEAADNAVILSRKDGGKTVTIPKCSIDQLKDKKDRKDFYLEYDEYFYRLSFGKKDESTVNVDKPENVQFGSYKEGYYPVTWNAVDNAIFYHCQIEYYGENDKLLWTNTEMAQSNNNNVSIRAIDGNPVTKIKVRVKAVSITGNESSYSAWAVQAISNELPVPKFHLEQEWNENDGFKYRAYLDNKEDYEALVGKEGLKDILISITGAQSAFKFKASEGKSSILSDTSRDDNINFMATATDNSKTYLPSVLIQRESMAPSHNYYMGTSAIVSFYLSQKEHAFAGFKGTVAEAMKYQIVLKAQTKICFARNEFVAKDSKLGIPVVLAKSISRTSDTSQGMEPTEMGPLPTDLLENYEDYVIRGYPMVMANGIVYNGHDVPLPEKPAGKKWEEFLKELYVTEDHYVTTEETKEKLIDQQKLSQGFVLEKKQDDAGYELYFNALLYHNDLNNIIDYDNLEVNKTSVSTQVSYCMLDKSELEKKIASKPVITVNPVQKEGNWVDGDPNTDIMNVGLDLQKKVNATYDYTLTGVTWDDKKVQIANGTYVSGTDSDNIVPIDMTGGNYKTVIIDVQRRGEVNANGMTTVFANSSQKEVALMKRLSQIPVPKISLHKTEGEETQKDSLNYDITWKNIPEEEREFVKAYEISVIREEEDQSGIRTYPDEDSYTTALAAWEALYKEKSGSEPTESEENGNMIYTYEWTEKGSNGVSVVKDMKIIADPVQNQITLDLSETWTVLNTDDKFNTSDSIMQSIGLDDYQREAKIQISVRALAKDNKEYRDGVEGVPGTTTLPSRLKEPVMTSLKMEPKYEYDEETHQGKYMTQPELADGLSFSYETSDELEDIGQYQIAMAVYDAKEDDSYVKMSAGDNPEGDTTKTYWNYGAIKTLIQKADGEKMSGDLLKGSYLLQNLSADYAGKWLKIAMRSISDSNVSSYWSDEDATAEQTLNYAWIRIPRVQISVPDMKKNTSLVYYDDDSGDHYTIGTGDSTAYILPQPQINLKPVKYADGYMFTRVRCAVGGNDDARVIDVDTIYLENTKNPQQMNVFVTTTNADTLQKINEMRTGSDLCKKNPYATQIGSITYRQEKEMVLPFTNQIDLSADEQQTVISTLSWTAEGISIMLPDGGKAHLSTETLSTQAYSFTENHYKYENSKIRTWKNNDSWKDTELAIAPTSTSVTYGELQTLGDDTSSYTLSVEAYRDLTFEIVYCDASGNPCAYSYKSAKTSGHSLIKHTLEFAREDIDSYAKLKIRSAYITSNSGIGEWSDWTEFNLR